MNTDHVELDTSPMQPPGALQELGAVTHVPHAVAGEWHSQTEEPSIPPPVVSLSSQFVVPAQTPENANSAIRCPTVITNEWKASGELESDGDILIEGTFEGKVMLCGAGAITVGDQASVSGELMGKNVVLKGHFKGDLDASDGTVTIEGSSRVEGKVTYSNIRMEGGQHSIELVYVPKRAI